MSGALLIISGPSGAGKSSLIKEILRSIPNAVFSISTTTREMREGEKHGVNYFFTDRESFQRDIDAGFFVEWANVHGNFYGTSLRQINDALEADKLVVLDIDVQGFMVAREKLGRYITSVFVTTKDADELAARLRGRGSDSEEVIAKRLKNAAYEMRFMGEYEYLIINDNFDDAKQKMLDCARAASSKRSLFEVDRFVGAWGQN